MICISSEPRSAFQRSHLPLPSRPSFRPKSPFSSKQFHLLSRSFSADDLFIYYNRFNKYHRPFVKLAHLLSFSPYTTPEKWAYHLPSPSTPNSPGKIAFSLILIFVRYPIYRMKNEVIITYELRPKIFAEILIFRGGKRVIYRTINGIRLMITTPPFYSWKLDWRFRVDIQWEQAARKDRFIKVSKAHKAQYVVSYSPFLPLHIDFFEVFGALKIVP